MKRIFFALIAFVFLACNKDVKDEQLPLISVTSPANNQTFAPGQTIQVLAQVSDNDGLHEVAFHVRDVNADTTMIHFHAHADAKNYELNKTFTAQAGLTYKIEIEATDHSENQTKKEIIVLAN